LNSKQLPLAPPDDSPQVLRGLLVWWSAHANTEPNPTKAIEMQVTTTMVSIGIVRSSVSERIIADPPVANLIEVKTRL